MARHRNFNWSLKDEGVEQSDGSRTFDQKTIELSLLMDIRDAMQENNRKLHVVIDHVGWSGTQQRELRGLRRDLKSRLKPRCHRAHK